MTPRPIPAPLHAPRHHEALRRRRPPHHRPKARAQGIPVWPRRGARSPRARSRRAGCWDPVQAIAPHALVSWRTSGSSARTNAGPRTIAAPVAASRVMTAPFIWHAPPTSARLWRTDAARQPAPHAHGVAPGTNRDRTVRSDVRCPSSTGRRASRGLPRRPACGYDGHVAPRRAHIPTGSRTPARQPGPQKPGGMIQPEYTLTRRHCPSGGTSGYAFAVSP